jgi:ferric-dicitrate binding protein FerR (iron transport regulator)
MAKPEDGSKLALDGTAEHEEAGETSDRELYLDEGRTLKVTRAAGEQVVEVRAASGQLELRVRLTDQGPVLQMEAVKLALTAEESVAIKCKTFEVEASGDTLIQSGGELKIKSDGELEVESPEDVRIRGKIIWLN